MRLLYHARIFTQDPSMPQATPQATALVMEGERILAIGAEEKLLHQYGAEAEKQDMQGAVLWPGLTDAHIHLDHYALALQMVNCETATRAECVRRVGERARSTPAGKWLRGHGWNHNVWADGLGNAAELDVVAGNIPVYLTAKSLHAAWVNAAGLREARITADTPDPAGGMIQRDEHGQPTGILFEAAMSLVEDVIPARTSAESAEAIAAAQVNLWRYGITSVHDFDGSRCFEALQLLDAQNRLKLRVVKSIQGDKLEHAAALGLRMGFGNDRLRIGSVKLFSDGALGPHTAAMFAPYQSDGDNSGILLLDNEQVLEIGILAAEHGLSLAIHAIGDRANHEVLVGLATLRQYETDHGLPHLRHRIEHVQVLHPADLNRLAELNVTASVQPIHATSDMAMADRLWGERCALAYAYGSLLESGAALCFGSDAPVESPNPFLGLHAAVTRRNAQGEPAPEGWYPAQRLTLAQALHGFTAGAAYAVGMEDRMGRLAPNAFADLIVLDVDPFTLAPQDLQFVQPVATMIGGQWVWQKDESLHVTQ